MHFFDAPDFSKVLCLQGHQPWQCRTPVGYHQWDPQWCPCTREKADRGAPLLRFDILWHPLIYRPCSYISVLFQIYSFIWIYFIHLKAFHGIFIFERTLLESARQGGSAVIEAYQPESNRAFARSSAMRIKFGHRMEMCWGLSSIWRLWRIQIETERHCKKSDAWYHDIEFKCDWKEADHELCWVALCLLAGQTENTTHLGVVTRSIAHGAPAISGGSRPGSQVVVVGLTSASGSKPCTQRNDCKDWKRRNTINIT